MTRGWTLVVKLVFAHRSHAEIVAQLSPAIALAANLPKVWTLRCWLPRGVASARAEAEARWCVLGATAPSASTPEAARIGVVRFKGHSRAKVAPLPRRSFLASRWLPLSGVAFVVLMLVVVVGFSGSTPSTGDPAAEIASFYDEQSVRQGIAAFLLAATVPFLLLFAASLAGRPRANDVASREIWRRMLLGGSFILGAIIMVMAMIHFALADGADDVAPAALQALNLLDGNFWVAANPALGVMMLGAAGLLLGVGVRMPRWLGWAALVFGVALFIPFADFFALLLSLIWIIVVSVLLFRTPHEEHQSIANTASE